MFTALISFSITGFIEEHPEQTIDPQLLTPNAAPPAGPSYFVPNNPFGERTYQPHYFMSTVFSFFFVFGF